MPLVFVHGVNVRDGPLHTETLAVRDAYFRRFVLKRPGSTAPILNPYWGVYGVHFRWGFVSRRCAPDEIFGPASDTFAGLRVLFQINDPVDGSILLGLARSSLAAAVDLAWAAAAHTPTNEISAENFVALAACAQEYVQRNPSPHWVWEVNSDEEFLHRLLREISPTLTVETFGTGNAFGVLRRAAVRLSHVPGRVLAETIRQRFGTTAAVLIGDVLEYVNHRGTRGTEGPIVSTVLRDLRIADAARTENDPDLVIVAHSMGGIIAYDILTYFADDIRCDAFVTVGSQVPLFEEMALFRASDPTIPNPQHKRVRKPANILRWINVFDPLDVLAFAASEVFNDVEDLAFSSSASPAHAHEDYFNRPDFYARLARRLSVPPV